MADYRAGPAALSAIGVRIILALVLSLLLSGCVTYRGYPEPTPVQQAGSKRLTYLYDGSPGMFGGGPGLKNALRDSTVFSDIERVSERVDEGLFLAVEVKMLPPSVPAIAFGYLSVSFATLLPAWSTQDGYEILFHLYRDGERVRSFDYAFRRGSFVWLPMVLFIWVNLMTPDEEDAFRAVTERFLADVQPYL